MKSRGPFLSHCEKSKQFAAGNDPLGKEKGGVGGGRIAASIAYLL